MVLTRCICGLTVHHSSPWQIRTRTLHDSMACIASRSLNSTQRSTLLSCRCRTRCHAASGFHLAGSILPPPPSPHSCSIRAYSMVKILFIACMTSKEARLVGLHPKKKRCALIRSVLSGMALPCIAWGCAGSRSRQDRVQGPRPCGTWTAHQARTR